jgi:S1-C subfamily serine protease
MNIHKTNRIWLALTILVLAALACQQAGGGPVTTPTPVQTEPTPVATDDGGLSQAERDKLISATVQIYGLFDDNGELTPHYTGSGTILTSSGVILTNAHVASPASQGDAENEPDALGIAIIASEDKPPVASYLAKVLAVDGYMDLAVIQIVSTIDGADVDTSGLNLPFVELGDSNQTHVGDHLNIFGFPGIGGDTITFTEGSVSGFISEDQLGDRAWIKTDATIAGGNSGGLAADDRARIIGVPTIAASGGSGEVTDCRQIQDTNGDGTINKDDSCIPIGGFINALRPIELARSLIDTAQAGKEYVSPYRLPGQATEAGSGEEAATGFVWLDTANSSAETCDWSEDIVDAYASPAICIATVFEYSGMTNGEPVRELWYLNDEAVSEYPFSWEWDAEGRFATYLPNDGDPMPPGEYHLEMYAGQDDHLIGTSDKVVVGEGDSGGTAQPPSEDTVTVYGVIYAADSNKPISGAYVIVIKGATYKEWQSENFADKYVVASMQVDKTGEYEITGVPRGIPLTYVFAAEGYLDSWGDDIVIPADDPATRWELNAEMSK